MQYAVSHCCVCVQRPVAEVRRMGLAIELIAVWSPTSVFPHIIPPVSLEFLV